jgi:hypothetical protein
MKIANDLLRAFPQIQTLFIQDQLWRLIELL